MLFNKLNKFKLKGSLEYKPRGSSPSQFIKATDPQIVQLY